MDSFWSDTKETVAALYETAIDEVKNTIETVRDTWPMILLLLVVLVTIIGVSNPPPPDRIVMSAGPEGSSYQENARKYAEFMAKRGITLELRPSSGGIENAQRVVDPKSGVDIALVPAGLIDPNQAENVVALGAVEYEPLWFFYKSSIAGSTDQTIRELLGKKVSIGPEGSATNFYALELLSLNKIDRPVGFVNMPHSEAVEALENGRIDGIFIVDGVESPTIARLIANPTLRLANFVRANAYTKALPYLERLVINEGELDLARDFPSQQLQILATTINLVSKESLHPAIQMLFLEAAKNVNGKVSFFSQRGEFPAYKNTRLPESEEALIYYEKGPPFLVRYLPFWLAEFIHRMFFILLPFVLVAYPILQSLPGYRIKRIKGRITKTYGDLKSLEQDMVQSSVAERYTEFMDRLEVIDKRATEMKVPKSIASDYFSLRSTIDFVRGNLEKQKSAS